ncbi:MAG: hypothetical protein PHQ28_08325 [Mycobacterium sp.]|nr:hypothetical protein [Mycobacterium sp.]
MNTHLQQDRTRGFARVLGPFFVIVAATTVARASDMRRLLSEFGDSPAWPWVTGAFLLLVALVIIALHPYWRGAAAITVSVVGWALALRAVFLMAFPRAFLAATDAAMGMPGLWVGVDIAAALLGLYLTHVGWGPGPRGPVTRPDTSGRNRRRAA